MARSTVDHGDVVDKAVDVLAVVVVLYEIAPGGNSHVKTKRGLAVSTSLCYISLFSGCSSHIAKDYLLTRWGWLRNFSVNVTPVDQMDF